MKREFLAYLVCPDSLSQLELRVSSESSSEVITGELVGDDDVVFPIRDGIPSFTSRSVEDEQTVRSFAQKWQKHRYYREHTSDFYTDWFLKRYGFGDLDGLRAFLDGMRVVLDAGTGAGRDAVNFARHSSATVFVVDTAWEALATQAGDDSRPDFPLVHADVNHLPFPDEFFDFINCDQVIHHTPDPPATLLNLRRKLKVGGEVCCYVYRKKAVLREFADDYVRERIKELPAEEALQVCEGITHLGKALAALKATVQIEHDIPVLGIKKGTQDVQRFIHWNVMKCFWNDDFDFFTNNIINFDWYHPEYCHRYEPKAFRAWFDDGWEVLHWDVQEAGISCRARRR